MGTWQCLHPAFPSALRHSGSHSNFKQLLIFSPLCEESSRAAVTAYGHLNGTPHQKGAVCFSRDADG